MASPSASPSSELVTVTGQPERASDHAAFRRPAGLIAALDLAVVAALALGVCVLVFGGFREFIGPVRLSVRGADRLLLTAAVLFVARHALAPTPPITVALRRTLARAWASTALASAGPAFLATRLGVVLVAYFAVVTIGIAPGTARFSVSDQVLPNLFARWDAFWYLSIAGDGYHWDGDATHEQNVVFFPLFPALMRLLGLFLGQRWLLAGVIVSLAAFLGALVYLHRLARDLLGETRAAAAVWLLATYPFAIYFGAPYTEGVYLLAALGLFFHLHHAHWARAAAWGLAAGLCRPNGFFLAGPAALLVLRYAVAHKRVPWGASIAAVAPVIGMLAYSGYLGTTQGDPLAWMKGQQAWGRVFVGLGPGAAALVGDRYHAIATYGLDGYLRLDPYDAMHSAAALLVLASIWPCTRRFGPAYGVFVAANVLPPLLMGGMMSIGRMSSVLFPVFLWLAAALPARYLSGWLAVSCLLQGLMAVLFFTWRPMF